MNTDIRIFGARQNNLRNLDLDIHTGQLLVMTGVSGSGKSSLAFDTLYAEGQRRYVETFSPYARQFLDRMDKPRVDRIEGILPAIAIDQVNPVRNSRSTVGTMSELNDHLKLLYARMGRLHCRGCGQPVEPDTVQSVTRQLHARCQADDPRLVISFEVTVPENFTEEEVRRFLDQQGYAHIHSRETRKLDGEAKKKKAKGSPAPAQAVQVLHVVQDRFRIGRAEAERVTEALEQAFRRGHGELTVFVPERDPAQAWRFSQHLHCAQCNIRYHHPLPSHFSFNSPLGACEECRGFGRVMGIDYGLVIPDESRSLRDGAIRPFQTATYKPFQADMENYAGPAGIRLDTPWSGLDEREKQWVIEGTPDWKSGRRAWDTQWYGVRRFFAWLESRSYRMHVRVLLSKYRSYTPCPSCQGARLKPDALLWRLGAEPGLGIARLMRLPISEVREFFDGLSFGETMDAALALLLDEVRTRLRYLCEVGLGYLSLDRQSRTLSGGEVQRINLTTALGTSLVNTLFVLDEPSIGLHPRDIHRITRIMHRLRANGNTLVVVEHDPQIIVAADRVLDIGPGPGERGGRIVFDGTPDALRQANTLTGRYLGGHLQVEAPLPRAVSEHTPRLLLEGASAHNLKNIDVSFPLGHLVCVTGVSGSGKSTLIQDVLYPAFLRQLGKPTEAPGAHRQLLGSERLADIVLVDQSPIGKTARSNPASYVGAYDAIRKLFAQAPLARQRSYGPGMFSFNTGEGRCPGCGGTGFEHVEMQFLSDIYLRCPDCDGSRFRPEIREIRVEHLGRSASIDEVLDMTVSEALDFFSGLHDVQRGLAPLADVGLEYLRLGQPVPTLSGGEAQRLKLAGHLAASARSKSPRNRLAVKGSLFLFDEPTTGLHFDDVARLMQAFRKLLGASHSLIIIEHNLDVIRAADWIIDLGPEGGEEGGNIVATGTPATLMAHAHSHTGQALADYARQLTETGGATALAEAQPDYACASPAPKSIEIVNAREHNLKGISLAIPQDAFTVVTGVSGSGKSTLAFDILFNEGQRRYLESLNAYARAIVQPAGKPDVDAIYGIPPTVAIEQRTSRGGYKSTVATMTEIHHFLRLIYVRLGTQMCPDCDVPVQPQSAAQIAAHILTEYRGMPIRLLAPLVTARKGYYTDLAKWAAARGYAQLRVDGTLIPVSPWPRLDRYKEHTIELPVAELAVDPAAEARLREAIDRCLDLGQGNLLVLGPQQEQHFSVRRACPCCGRSFPEPDPRLFSYNSRHGWCPQCFGTGVQLKGFDAEQTGEEANWSEQEDDGLHACPACAGERLNPVSRAVLWHGLSIARLGALSVLAARKFFAELDISGREAEITRDILAEIRSRLSFMETVGLGYLELSRPAPTLSGGEAQRIRLAAQLGSNLQGVCYVLDEPTIGLHPRDNQILLQALHRLQTKGNTLVVVEHDEDTIRRADHIIDMGPGAGVRGGRVVAQGSLDDIMACPASITGRYLREPLEHPSSPRRAVNARTDRLRIRGAHRHNLQNINADIPLGRLTVVSGVSGSGKSTLARDVLLANMARAVSEAQAPVWRGCREISGWEAIERVLEVDQTPIGKTPRSCPATYIGFWDEVRRLFASTQDARIRGWNASRFSFNTGDGRCEVCQGQGMRTLEMSFLPDVKVLCDACNGARFNRDTLGVTWGGHHAGDMLAMNVDEAIPVFAAHPKIRRALQLMQDVGLGYLTLGQASPTLSGGEAQRIKLVSELVKARLDEGVHKTGRASRRPHTLYVLDEPTVGLAMADVEKLIAVLHRLTDAGNTVVVIEHNLDVIAQADWLVDLGPEGGTDGGRLAGQGTPAQIMARADHSHTGRMLAAFLEQHAQAGRKSCSSA